MPISGSRQRCFTQPDGKEFSFRGEQIRQKYSPSILLGSHFHRTGLFSREPAQGVEHASESDHGIDPDGPCQLLLPFSAAWIIGSMQGSVEVVPRRLRRRLFETAWARWLVPLLRCIALPLAESRKRFLVPLWVLILLLPLPLLIALADRNFFKSISVGYLRIGENNGADRFWEVLLVRTLSVADRST